MSNTAPNIHDAAWEGTLNATTFRLCAPEGRSKRTILDSRGRIEDITPLAAACWQGHLDVVRLLLHEGANPNALSQRNRTPLFYATCKSPTRDRAAIVRALLDNRANIDKCCGPDDDDYTPLMFAIVETRDTEVIHELVDRGASLDVSRRGRTPKDLAKERRMERHLLPRSERNTTRAVVVAFLMQVVLFVAAVFEKVKEIFGMSGEKDSEIQKDLEELAEKRGVDPRTPQGFEASLDSYVQESGLEKFFAPGDSFLKTLAQKASNLRNDPNSTLGTAQNLKRLIRYSLYQTVLYCDDSQSMEQGNRWENQKELVVRIADIATKIVPDGAGVGLHFINSNPPSSRDLNLSASQVLDTIEGVKPWNGTPIGTHLRKKILDPLIYKVLDQGKLLQRPFLVCILTDGEPGGEAVDSLKKEILGCRRKLLEADYEPSATITFLISQIGDNERAKVFLDDLSNDTDMESILYLTTDRLDSQYENLKNNERGLEEWLLKTLSGPIMERGHGGDE